MIGCSWGWVLAFGVANLVLGILVIIKSKNTIYGFALLLGIWLMLYGLLQMVTSLTIRKVFATA